MTELLPVQVGTIFSDGESKFVLIDSEHVEEGWFGGGKIISENPLVIQWSGSCVNMTITTGFIAIAKIIQGLEKGNELGKTNRLQNEYINYLKEMKDLSPEIKNMPIP